jgi:hypothetical protein
LKNQQKLWDTITISSAQLKLAQIYVVIMMEVALILVQMIFLLISVGFTTLITLKELDALTIVVSAVVIAQVKAIMIVQQILAFPELLLVLLLELLLVLLS